MKTAIIIPVRLDSVRLPEKALLAETGKPLIEHVVENARRISGIDKLLVATDSERVAAAARVIGAEVTMTSAQHKSGTDRIAEAAAALDAELIVNIQGDEPEIEPAVVESLIACMRNDTEARMGTLATPIREERFYRDPATVKVVCAADGTALYFSRAPIPHFRDGVNDQAWNGPAVHKHIGVYAYRKSFLSDFTNWQPTPLETAEKLEQLRALEHGVRIRVVMTEQDPHGIDTPDDYRRFVEQWKALHAG